MTEENSGQNNGKKEISPAKFIEARVASTFPGNPGPKFTAKYATETNEYVGIHFVEIQFHPFLGLVSKSLLKMKTRPA